VGHQSGETSNKSEKSASEQPRDLPCVPQILPPVPRLQFLHCKPTSHLRLGRWAQDRNASWGQAPLGSVRSWLLAGYEGLPGRSGQARGAAAWTLELDLSGQLGEAPWI